MKSFGPTFVVKGLLSAALLLGTPGLGVMQGPPANATTVLKLALPDMVQGARWVIRARVLGITNVDERTTTRGARDGLFTDVQLEVLETYAGTGTPATVTMRLIGGRGADGIVLTVPGMPKFRVGEETVLFLEPTRDGFIPVGLQQGVWRIVRTPVTPAMVEQNTNGLLLMGRDPEGALVPDAGAHAKPRTQLLLTDLERQIRAAVETR